MNGFKLSITYFIVVMNTSLLKTITHRELGLNLIGPNLINQIISNIGLLGNLLLETKIPHFIYKHWNFDIPVVCQ